MKILSKEGITLRPLTAEDIQPLYEMIADYPDIWRYMTSPVTCFEDMENYLMKSLDNPNEIPCTVIDQHGTVVGCTRLYSIDYHARSCELGHTWYVKEVQRTAVNTICKYLLLSYAFEELELNRVQLKAHAKNEKSIQAIQRIGGVYEGTLRYERPMPDGEIRDAVIYSFIRPEWPDKKAHLEQLLNQY